VEKKRGIIEGENLSDTEYPIAEESVVNPNVMVI